MAYNYVFTDSALHDLDNIFSYIKYHLYNEQVAKNLMYNIRMKLNILCEFPEISPIVENTFMELKDIRKAVVKNYVLYYFIDYEEEIISIIAIRHSLENQNRTLFDIKQ